MSDPVNPARRRYDVSGRRARAQQTREHVVSVAAARFVRDGYTTTTIASVAREAGVSPETIYNGFGSKAKLLRAAVETAIRGDAGPAPLRRRPAIDEIRREPRTAVQLKLYGRLLAAVQPRLAPLIGVMREAAGQDSEIAKALRRLDRDRLDGMAEFAGGLARAGGLRVTETEARDVLWTLNSPQVYELLVLGRGWTLDAYRRWVTEAMTAALLQADAR